MKKLLQLLGIKILPPLINLIFKTLKIYVHNEKVLEKGNYVLMFWHGKMLAGWWLGRKKNFYGVVSQSKDGEILSKLLQSWGYRLIRGSSSRDSKEVMNQMVDVLKAGYNLAITPDGPRGPSQKMKIGGLIAAVRADKSIVLCGIRYNEKFVFNSWDKFELPKPFSRVDVFLANPKSFSAGLSNEEYESIRTQIEEELITLSNRSI